jgi:hypothetical protein
VFAIFAVCCCFATASAEDHEYDGKKVKNERYEKLKCSIKVDGRSEVEGTYNRKDGVLAILIDGKSELEIRGEAHKVIIRLDGKSTLRLRGMKIGAGGVEITDMGGQSTLYLGKCEGDIDIKSVDGRCTIHCKEGTKVVGRANLSGKSELKVEK